MTIAQIETLLKNATPGPWHFTSANGSDDWEIYNSQFTFVKQDDSGVPVSDEDGALIAAAPQIIAQLLEVVKVQREALVAVGKRNDIYELFESGLYGKCAMALEAADKLLGEEK